MLPKRIILEGKSYLMLEENLGRLSYNPFRQGSINSKHYSDYEPITAVGIAPVDTVTRKTIDKKKAEVQDLKFAIKFKWNVDVLSANPDLFLRYYNYFESAPQTKDGKKAGVASSSITDFMPFMKDPVYSKAFNKILGEHAGELESEDILNEAAGAVAQEDPAALADNLNSFEDGFGGVEAGDVVDDGLGDTPKAGLDFYFYLVFKYDELYNHGEKMKAGAFHDGSNIEIVKLVSQGNADEPNIAITGRVLEKKAIGFYRELLGLLNANHKSIMKAVNEEEKELELDLGEIPSQEGELNFDPNGQAEGAPNNGEFEVPGAEESPSETLTPSYQTVEDANVGIRNDQIAKSPSEMPESEREKALARFKQSSVNGI